MMCPVCNGEMWDNREGKKNPRAPDFKCKDKNCDGVIWPPRGKKPVGTPTQSNGNATRTAPATGNWSEERSARIERQHSQDMALRLAAIDNRKFMDEAGNFDLKKLRWFIDWFQKDVSHTPQAQSETPAPNEEEQF